MMTSGQRWSYWNGRARAAERRGELIELAYCAGRRDQLEESHPLLRHDPQKPAPVATPERPCRQTQTTTV